MRGMSSNRCPGCGTTYMLAGGTLRTGGGTRRRSVLGGSRWLALLTMLGLLTGVGGAVRGGIMLTSHTAGATRTFLGAALCLSVGLVALGWSRRVRALYLDHRGVS